jgi:hypothetical protein
MNFAFIFLATIQLMRDCRYSAINTPTMDSYTDPSTQAHAWAASHPSNQTHGGVITTIMTGIDWIPISIVCILTGWVCTQYYHIETGDISRTGKPFVRAIFAIFRRLAIDLVRFMLTILAITAELLLWGKNAWIAAIHKNRAEISRYTASALRPIATRVWLRYDTANHSHRANLARQHVRAFYTHVAGIMRWVAIIGVAYIILNGLPTINEKSPAEDEGQTHMVPVWVIKARPENCHQDGSSSHYRPEHDLSCVQEPHEERRVFGHRSVERKITGDPRKSTSHVERSQTWLSATRMDARGLDMLMRVQSLTADSTGESMV